MIYLNNAATSWPKPETTISNLQNHWKSSPEVWGDKFNKSLKIICEFFGIKDTNRFIITSGATASLNLVFSDIEWKKGDIVVTSSFEHHAVSGWELRLREQYQVEFKKIKSTRASIFDLQEFENLIETNHKNVKMVIFTHASNVTGDLVPMQEILTICQKYGIITMLDAAQSAGIIEIDIESLKPDIFLFAGHKGTMGPHGIGGLYLSDNVKLNIPGVKFENQKYNSFPTYCDMGSINLEGMEALASSMTYLQNMGFDEIDRIRDNLNSCVYQKLNALDEIEIISKSELNRTYAIAFRVKDTPVATVLAKLAERNCLIGAGFFCCSSAHIELGTTEEGVLRISAGLFTTESELDQFFLILREILDES